VNILKWTVGPALLAFCVAPALAEQAIDTAFNYNPAQAATTATQQSVSTAFSYHPAEPAAASAAPQSVQTAFNYNYSLSDDAAAVAPGCEAEASCGCEPSCGVEDGCCSSGCGDGGLFSGCCGDPWTLHDLLTPCSDHNYGGWVAVGYHSDLTGLAGDFPVPGGFNQPAPFDFNDRPDELNLHQAWVYFEKVADGSCCSSDWGYRFDIMYGTDAQAMQAGGNASNGWDRAWDHGAYGWAMPQAYVEYACGDFSVIGGRFITPLGYESSLAPDRFFYSQSLTSFNSEPFAHTGVLTKYKANDVLTLYNGWTLGWDTGFDQYGGGSNYLGGVTAEVSDDVTLTYLCTAGNFGFRSGDRHGYSHSAVVEVILSDNCEYALQSNYVDTDGAFGDPTFSSEDISANNYLFYTLNDCLVLGTRLEWWKSDQVNGQNTSFYNLTGGLNYWPHPNMVIRPEIRYDWTPSEGNLTGYNREIFGIDAVITF